MTSDHAPHCSADWVKILMQQNPKPETFLPQAQSYITKCSGWNEFKCVAIAAEARAAAADCRVV